jgi:hypothetical protein
VTSVPRDTSSNVHTNVISPNKAGSVMWKLTVSTISRAGASSREPHGDHAFKAHGATITGFRERQRKTAERALALLAVPMALTVSIAAGADAANGRSIV